MVTNMVIMEENMALEEVFQDKVGVIGTILVSGTMDIRMVV